MAAIDILAHVAIWKSKFVRSKSCKPRNTDTRFAVGRRCGRVNTIVNQALAAFMRPGVVETHFWAFGIGFRLAMRPRSGGVAGARATCIAGISRLALRA